MAVSVLAASAMQAGTNAIGAIGANVSSGLFGANQARKNRAFQERMYNRQIEDAERFWNMENAYNDPRNAYARELAGLKENGLNPLLMYGNGGTSQVAAGKPDLPSAPHGDSASAHFNNPIDMPNLALLEAQVANLNANTQKTESDAELTKEQTFGQQIQNWIAENTKNVSVCLAHGNYDLARAMIRKTDNDIFQSSFMNAETANTMILNRLYLMKNYDLHAWELGEMFKYKMQEVASGRIMANAAWKNANANMITAISNYNFNNAQIGYLATKVALNRQLYSFNEKNNPLQLRHMNLLNTKFKAEINTEQQNAVNMFLKNGYQFMQNSYYKRYGVNQLPTGRLMNEVIPISKQFENQFNGWQPMDDGFNELMNVFSIPLENY